MISESMNDPNFDSQVEVPSAERQCAEEGVVVEECSTAVLISSFGASLHHFTIVLSLMDMQQFPSFVCTLHIPDYNVHTLWYSINPSLFDPSARPSSHIHLGRRLTCNFEFHRGTRCLDPPSLKNFWLSIA